MTNAARVRWRLVTCSQYKWSRSIWRMPADLHEQGMTTHPSLVMKHCFVRVHCGVDVPVDAAAESLHAGFERACNYPELAPGMDGLLTPFNLLAGDVWLLLVPRSQECFEEVSISAVGFGGTLYTRTREQIETIRNVGPLVPLSGRIAQEPQVS